MQRFQALSNINQNFPNRRAISNETVHHKNYSLDFGDSEDDVSYCPQRSFLSERNNLTSSFRSLVTEFYSTADDQASTSGAPTDLSLRNEVRSAAVCYIHYSLALIKQLHVYAQSWSTHFLCIIRLINVW